MQRKKPLARKSRLKTETVTHGDERRAFRERVFARWGPRCWRCGETWGEIDPAHVIPRSDLTKAQRYAFPEINGRPLCRACHKRQESGRDPFPEDVIRAAAEALDTLQKTPGQTLTRKYGFSAD